MINIRREYETLEQDLAALMAFLTNSSLKHSNGKIILTNDHNLKEHIDQLLKEQKFMDANELIKSAKILLKESSIDANIISKSYRVPFPMYLRIISIAARNDETISDILKKILVPSINSTLAELQSFPEIEKNKNESLKKLVLDWNKAKTSSRAFNTFFDLHVSGVDRTRHHDYILKYFREIILKKCSEEQLNEEYALSITDKFIKIHVEPYIDPFITCTFNFDSEVIKCEIEYNILYSLIESLSDREEVLNLMYEGSLDVANSIKENNEYLYSSKDVMEEFFDEIINITPIEKNGNWTVVSKDFGKFQNIVNDILGKGATVSLGIYEVDFNKNKLLFNGVELENVEATREILYRTLISESELLPLSFDVDEKSKILREALSDDDYESASKYSQELEIYEIIDCVSKSLAEMLKIKENDSEVITVSMPKAVSMIIDLAKDKRSNKAFISEICLNYFESTRE
ncbi:hypothetical protein J2755_001292 [Methanohalophilus levihalophilus]|uniref:hypothetical protein n=1 Tax=Methanohalophilus levihalophilus TaxID=1431282 RepID=UPI001AE69F0A|nr:hypothetical protein [Methanohalophilus levihalophilus]MBP2030358.1 hypothetical protein [Methanohalophilus levihalophilus]